MCESGDSGLPLREETPVSDVFWPAVQYQQQHLTPGQRRNRVSSSPEDGEFGPPFRDRKPGRV